MQHGSRIQRPHFCSLDLERRQPLVQGAHRVSEFVRNDFLCIPFGYVLRTSDEAIEWHEKGHDPLDASELVSELPAQFRHGPW